MSRVWMKVFDAAEGGIKIYLDYTQTPSFIIPFTLIDNLPMEFYILADAYNDQRITVSNEFRNSLIQIAIILAFFYLIRN